jgi:DNA helicase-2/ATP-dependent DNA helicase PcrA
MAILFRTNAQQASFERACAQTAVPVAIPPRQRLLDRPEMQRLLERLDATQRAAPRRSLHDHLSDLTAWADDDQPADADERVAADELVRLVGEYLESDGGRGSLSGFLAWAEVATRGEHAASVANAVALSTFHRAKGLEWSIVCVTGLEQGLVPIAYATTDVALAEERRLLHVALSRAHDVLHLSWARQRTFGARAGPRTQSPWLDAPIAASLPGPADRVPDPRVALSDVRGTLASARPPQPRPHAARRRGR